MTTAAPNPAWWPRPRFIYPGLIGIGALAAAVVGGLLYLTLSGGASAATQVNKLAVYVMENNSQAPSYAAMPYLSSLAAQYGKATAYTGVTHPSEGNYVTMLSGQGKATCGIPDPKVGQCNQPGGTVFGQAIAAGRTAKLYQEDMRGNCGSNADYGHNPWLHFPSEASLCQSFDVPSGEPSGGALAADIAAGSLPNLSMIVPNDCNNAHDCPLSTADSYMKGWMTSILAGPDWKAGHLAVVLVFDEGETTEDVAFVVVSPTVAGGTVFSGKADHNSLERLYAAVAGVPAQGGGTTATDLAAPFGFNTAGTGTTTTVPPPATTVTDVPPGPTTTAAPAPSSTLHYTANISGDIGGAVAVGYNLLDTGPDKSSIDGLPAGVRALVWIGEKCPSGVNPTFTSKVDPLAGDPKVYGYFMSDEPDPAACSQGPGNIAAEADYLHSHNPGQQAFAVIDDTPGGWAAYAPSKSHLDLIGQDPYPCRHDTGICNFPLIAHDVNAAIAAGVPREKIVPTFQLFGDKSWFMPSPAQLNDLLAEWAKVVPSPVFDYSYSWGCQGGSLSDCLVNHPEARTAMASHNRAANPPPTTTPPSSSTTRPPVGSTTLPPTTPPPTPTTTVGQECISFKDGTLICHTNRP